MSNSKIGTDYITMEFAYVSDKGILTQDYFNELRRSPEMEKSKEQDIDPALSNNNETVIDKPIDAAYEEIFGAAAKEYNAKYKGKNMTGAAYLARQEQAKAKNIAYDMTVCIGARRDADHKGQCVERDILKDYLADFISRNKQHEVIGAYMHGDEKSKPVHLHIVYVPWADGYATGMPRQFSLSGALKAADAKKNVPDSEMKLDWSYAEREALETVAKKYKVKIEWPQPVIGYGFQGYIEKHQEMFTPSAGIRSKSSEPNGKVVYMKWTTAYASKINEIRKAATGVIPYGDEVPIDMPLEEAYEQAFGCTAREYTWRHPENPRTAQDYLRQRTNGKMSLTMIMTVQIGTIKETPQGEDAVERKILKEYAIKFIRVHPSFKIMGAYIHGNEEGRALHLHILFIPWGDGFDKGMYRQFSLDKALTQDGFIQNEKVDGDCFTNHELTVLRELCDENGIEMLPIYPMKATDQDEYFGSPAWMQMEAEGHPYYEENLNRAAY